MPTYRVDRIQGSAGHEQTLWSETIEATDMAEALANYRPNSEFSGWVEYSRPDFASLTNPETGRRYCDSLTIELGECQEAKTMQKQAQITRVNIYRRAGQWCYRADDADGYDHSDVLDVADDATEAEARAQAREDFPHAEIFRVADA